MITVKVDDKTWIQFPDGTPSEKINKRIKEWIRRRTSVKRREIAEVKYQLMKNSNSSSYSDELSRLTILNQYRIAK